MSLETMVKGGYPSRVLVEEWRHEFYYTDGRPSYDADAFMAFQIRKACDFQREQDALICESFGTRPTTELYDEGMRDMQRQCSDAIRLAKTTEGSA